MENSWRIVESLEEFREMEGEWNDLLEESGVDSVFLTFEWILSWLETLGLERKLLLVRGEGKDWKGFFPLYLRERSFPGGKVRIASFIGDPEADRCDFLISGNRETALAAFLGYCRERPFAVDLLSLKQISADSPSSLILKKLLPGSGFRYGYRVCDRAPVVILPASWGEYLGSLSSSFRKKLRKYFLAVEKRGGVRIEEEPFSPRVWETILSISRRSPKQRRGIAFFSPPGREEFARSLLERFSAAGRLSLYFLLIDNRPVAYDLGFRYRGKTWSYESAFDRELADCAPGHLLLALMIQAAIKRGEREFDLLRGSETYKFNWTGRYREHLEFTVYLPGLLSTLVRWANRGRSTARFLLRIQIRFFGREGLLRAGWIRVFSKGQDSSRLSVTATTRKGGFALKVFTEVNELVELEADWEHLLDQLPSPSPFMSSRWIIPWLEAYGSQGEILILAAYRKNDLIGICPLILRKNKFLGLPARLLEFAGSPLSDRMDMIIPEQKEEVVELFWDYLWEIRSRWDVVRLGEVLAGSFNLTVIGDLLLNRKVHHFFRTCSIAPFIPLDQEWEAYLRSRSKNFRRRIRRDLRRIKSAGKVKLAEAKASDWKLFREISFDSPKFGRGTSLFLKDGIDRFVPAFLQRFEEAGWLNCKLMTLDGEPISFMLSFKFRNKIWLFNNSFRYCHRDLHPGHVILALFIQESIKKNFEEMDYLRGAEPYKFHYTNEIRYHREIMVFNRAFRGEFLRILYGMKTILKRWLGKETRLPGKEI